MPEYVDNKIHQFIKSQFPDFYKEEGLIFIAFLTEYYKWMEQSGKPLYYTRNTRELMDIDSTVDDFLVYFKETYLKDIQFDTTVNIRQLVKHSLDLYRSKGSPQAIDLLFKIVFGVGTEIYFPRNDIFRLSSAKYRIPRYIEVSLNDENSIFAGKQITGLKSGAVAFVEKVIRRKVVNKVIDVFYISAIKGNFELGEIIGVNGNEEINSLKISIIGSLSNIEIDQNGIGIGYSVGDTLELYSSQGREGKGRVAKVVNFSGAVDYNFASGGYGYSDDLEILISNNVLTISNVSSNNIRNEYFYRFENVYQRFANLSYTDYSGDSLEVGADVYLYSSINLVKTAGKIVSLSPSNSNSGSMCVGLNLGNAEANTFYLGTNVGQGTWSNVSSYTSYANLLHFSDEITLYYSNVSGAFISNVEIYQLDSFNNELANGIVSNAYAVGSNGYLKVTNSMGVFNAASPIKVRSSNVFATMTDLYIKTYINQVNGTFVSGINVFFANSNSNGKVVSVSFGTGVSVFVSNSFLYKEKIYLNKDILGEFSNVNLNAPVYGFDAFTNSNANTILGDVLSWGTKEIGKISSATIASRGENYTLAPYIDFYEPSVVAHKKQDLIVEIAPIEGNFTYGEMVIQETTGARGLIKTSSTSNTLYLERLNFYDEKIFVSVKINPNTDISNNFINISNSVFETNDRIQYFVRSGNTAISGLSNGNFYYVYDSNSSGFNLSLTSNGNIINVSSSVSENGHVFVKSPNISFIPTTNSTNKLVGVKSGFSANVISVSVDEKTEFIGFNADTNTSILEGNGAITDIEIIDSGFGYFNKEKIYFDNKFGTSFGYANVFTQGKGLGYYETSDGFLSSEKKLPDGHYYQPYSYEIRSSITLNKYEEMLKKILHVSGMKLYGLFIYNTEKQFSLNVYADLVYKTPATYTFGLLEDVDSSNKLSNNIAVYNESNNTFVIDNITIDSEDTTYDGGTF